jgi:hypothetical protein
LEKREALLRIESHSPSVHFITRTPQVNPVVTRELHRTSRKRYTKLTHGPSRFTLLTPRTETAGFASEAFVFWHESCCLLR